MKVHTNILLLLVFVSISSFLYSQETPNLDDYILDTIIQYSPDSSIVDTLITARRRIVVKKEFVVENQVFVAPVFNDVLLSAFISPLWSFNSALSYKDHNVQYKITPSVGIMAGIGLQTSIKKKLEAALELSYNLYNEQFNYTAYTYTPSQRDSIVTDTIETFYIDTLPQYITNTQIISLTDTLTDSLQTNANNKYRSICIALSFGKKIKFKHFQLCPKLSVAYEYTFSQKGFSTDSTFRLINLDEKNNYHNLKLGLEIDFIVPIKERFGIEIAPQINIFSKNINPLYSSTRADFGVSLVLFYKII
ncbi:MAG: hypothetical protein IPO21_18210 [Bacteroidales bacterium]|nr:hypothetical protein [Bacteroidales bacterium]